VTPLSTSCCNPSCVATNKLDENGTVAKVLHAIRQIPAGTLALITHLFALQFAPRNVTIQAFINKAPKSVAVTQPRSINELDFSKGGLPLYLWVPRGDLITRPAEHDRERNVHGAVISSRDKYHSLSQIHDLPPQLIFQVCFARQKYTTSANLTLMLTVT
jgi:hypothetical protein